jgi:hypothetical protein
MYSRGQPTSSGGYDTIPDQQLHTQTWPAHSRLDDLGTLPCLDRGDSDPYHDLGLSRGTNSDSGSDAKGEPNSWESVDESLSLGAMLG